MTKKDFEFRLKALTRVGNPSIMGTPFILLNFPTGDQPFVGEITDSKFKLTNNSVMSPSGAIIEGTYNSDDNTTTSVTFKIRPMMFPHFWVRFVPLAGLIFFNTVIIVNSSTLDLSLIVLVSSFCSIGFLWAIWREKRQARKLQTEFVDEFELTN